MLWLVELDPQLVIVVSYFFFLLPIMIGMVLILYDGIFHTSRNVLSRMIQQLPENEKEIAVGIRKSRIRGFRVLMLSFILWINITLWILYYITYIRDDEELAAHLFPYLEVTYVFFSLPTLYFVIFRLNPRVEIQQWQAVLAANNLDTSILPNQFTHFQKKIATDWYILARSYFKAKYQKNPVYYLPEVKFWDPFGIKTKRYIDNYLLYDKTELRADLKVAKLWIDYHRKNTVVAFGIINMLISLAGFLTIIFPSSNYLLPIELTQTSNIFVAIVVISVLTLALATFSNVLYTKNMTVNKFTIQKILDLQDITYNEDDYEAKLTELLESHFPYHSL